MLKFLLKSTKIAKFLMKIHDFLPKIAKNDFSVFRDEKMLKIIAKIIKFRPKNAKTHTKIFAASRRKLLKNVVFSNFSC